MTKSKFLLTIIISVICNLSLFAQIETKLNSSQNIFVKVQETGNAEVVIFQDMRINDLVYNHIERNKREGGISGYRIRIYADLGSGAREQSQSTKARFYELFPEIPIYREYVSPYFRVLVGDYRNRVDALKDFNQIKKYFRSAFIVPDKINYPELDE